jgi:hypothetical protein
MLTPRGETSALFTAVLGRDHDVVGVFEQGGLNGGQECSTPLAIYREIWWPSDGNQLAAYREFELAAVTSAGCRCYGRTHRLTAGIEAMTYMASAKGVLVAAQRVMAGVTSTA